MRKLDEDMIRSTYRVLQEQHPEILEWAKDKARWEHVPIGVIFTDYEEYIRKMIQDKEEDVID